MLMYVLKIQYFKQEYYIMKSYLYTRKLYYEHFTTAFWLFENTSSKGEFVLKNWVETFALKIFGMTTSFNEQLCLRIPYTHNTF